MIQIEKKTAEQKAAEFLQETGTTFKCVFHDQDFYFPDDTKPRDIYKITLRRGRKTWTFKFGQSLCDTGKNIAPTAFNVLSVLQKFDPDTFENFCADYGYNNDSRKAEKIYHAVKKEFNNVSRLFTPEEIELLQEVD